MKVGQLGRRHRPEGAACQLVDDVAPARAAENAVDRVAAGVEDFREVLAAGHRLLLHRANDRDGARDLGHGGGIEGRAVAMARVLQQDRQVGARRDGVDEGDLIGGGRPCGARGHDHRHHGPGVATGGHVRDHLGGRVRAGSDDEGDAPAQLVAQARHEDGALRIRQVAHFGGDAGEDAAIGPAVDHECNERIEIGQVDGPVIGERRAEDGKGSGEVHLTAPAVTPCTKNRCSAMKPRITGVEAKSDAAIAPPQSAWLSLR